MAENKQTKVNLPSMTPEETSTLKNTKRKAVSVSATSTSSRGRLNVVKGRVVSDKADKTISVLIYRLMKHPKYKKYIRRQSVFRAHDEHNQAKAGDIVSIYETRPRSKTKRWKLLNIEDSGDRRLNG